MTNLLDLALNHHVGFLNLPSFQTSLIRYCQYVSQHLSMMFPNGSDCSSLLKTYPNLCLTKSEVSFLEFKIQKNRQSAVSFLLFKIQHVVNSRIHNIFLTSVAVWCFGTFFVFPYIGNNHPNGLIFFRGVGIPPTRYGIPSKINPRHELAAPQIS